MSKSEVVSNSVKNGILFVLLILIAHIVLRNMIERRMRESMASLTIPVAHSATVGAVRKAYVDMTRGILSDVSVSDSPSGSPIGSPSGSEMESIPSPSDMSARGIVSSPETQKSLLDYVYGDNAEKIEKTEKTENNKSNKKDQPFVPFSSVLPPPPSKPGPPQGPPPIPIDPPRPQADTTLVSSSLPMDSCGYQVVGEYKDENGMCGGSMFPGSVITGFAFDGSKDAFFI
jgi:hypothetical protein